MRCVISHIITKGRLLQSFDNPFLNIQIQVKNVRGGVVGVEVKGDNTTKKLAENYGLSQISGLATPLFLCFFCN